MPIKPPNQSSKVKEAPNSFTQRRLRDSRGPFRHFDQNPAAPKGDREASKSDRIYMKPEFRKAVGAEEENFRKKTGGGGGW